MKKPILLLVLATFLLAVSTRAQSLSSEKRAAMESADAVRPKVEEMALTLSDYAETALREEQSADLLIRMLEEEGFAIERGIAGMPTAFVATYGSGAPTVGILAEYDALPGVGNKPVPYRAQRDDGIASGHGCGHNLFGAGSVGGAIAMKRAMEAEGVSGTIRLYGTPAEETLVGKVYMAKAGVFDDLDTAITWHPGNDSTSVSNGYSKAMNNFEVEFSGQPAHGAGDPWNGRSALDAVELMNSGVNYMREHIRPTARIHYVITDGGEAPNVVPGYAKVWYYARGQSRDRVDHYYEWIKDIAASAAQMTKTEHTVRLRTGVHATVLNRPLQETVQQNLEVVGPPQFTASEQEFGKELQRNVDKAENGYISAIKPLGGKPTPASGGSTDVAEVSHIVPTVSFGVTSAPAHIPWHSWATAASHARDTAVKSAAIAAKVIAMTGMDLMMDEELVQEAKRVFEENTEGEPYESPLPSEQTEPFPPVSAGG